MCRRRAGRLTRAEMSTELAFGLGFEISDLGVEIWDLGFGIVLGPRPQMHDRVRAPRRPWFRAPLRLHRGRGQRFEHAQVGRRKRIAIPEAAHAYVGGGPWPDARQRVERGLCL